MHAYVTTIGERFRAWWRAPVTRRDRVLGALIGALGAFWIGALGRMLVGTLPMPLSSIALSAVFTALVGAALGVLRPKVVMLVCFPFFTLGGGG